MALDIHDLLELELQHREDTEQHRDQTPPGPEPMANNPAEPDRADSPQSAPSRRPPRERASWMHLSNALLRHQPTHEATKGATKDQASLERDQPDITGQELHAYTTTPTKEL